MTPIQDILGAAGDLAIHHRKMESGLPLMAIAAHLASREGTVLLMSGGGQDSARHHILGIRPWLGLKSRGKRLELIIDGATHRLNMDPLEAVRAVLNRYTDIPPWKDVPLAAGLMGYLAYDLKDNLEMLPRTSVDRWELPAICLYLPSIVVVQNVRSAETDLYTCRPDGVRRQAADTAAPDLAGLARRQPPDLSFAVDPAVRSNFDQNGYEAAVERIREYIAAGDVYQVNLSQRFETTFEGSPFGFFQSLYEANPAPFFAFINAGDHTVVSTSPERFIKLADGRVETRPIKGTRPRHPDPETDRSMRDELLASPKDDAELSMIVDLLRNDLGRVCRGGTVRVTDHKLLEAYENVYHLVSTVEGRLDSDRDAVDILRAVFPGGSITGCPKIRAMEIIDELEPDRRHVYTGAIGYLSFHRTIDLSIAIRTAVIRNRRLTFAVGGGVVFDSDPRAEFEETLHKGRTLMDVCRTCRLPDPPTPLLWFNGRICPAASARVAVCDEGVRYGMGFFETIRADKGHIPLLTQHLERFNHTWQIFFETRPPDMTWAAVFAQVLTRNDLIHQTAVLRLTASAGDRAYGPRVNVWVTAQPYRHRLEVLQVPGLDLRVYPEARQTPWADFKTLNYLFYQRAGAWAREKGAHEALILNPDGSLSETNTANLLVIRHNRVFRPRSPHVLPGVMEQQACRALAERGMRIERKPLFPVDLYSADQVLLTNALMGVVPVRRLDDTPLAEPTTLSQELNAAIFGRTDVIVAP